MIYHYTENYLLNPQHKVTVNLIGLGGTGSHVLTALARLNEALIAFGHPGLHVYAYDGDIVTMANVGRQMFSAADAGLNKALVLVQRVNRYFGYEWEAIPHHYSGHDKANITISCVDTVATRLELGSWLKNGITNDPIGQLLYWLDFGNLQKTGQVVLGTLANVKQPTSNEYKSVSKLPTVVKLFPQLKKLKEVDATPSCSLAQALGKQDLFINSTLAQLGMNILWKLFREGRISHHGCFLNLDTMSVNPIKIK